MRTLIAIEISLKRFSQRLEILYFVIKVLILLYEKLIKAFRYSSQKREVSEVEIFNITFLTVSSYLF